jgi:hypothetical protein
VINSSDDFVFFRKNWIEDYFSMPNYCIVDSGFGSNGTRKPDKHNFETWDLNKLLNGQIQPKSYEPISSRIGDFSSSFTSNIIEIAGNFACLSDVNVWATILPGIIFNLFKVDIYRKIEPFSKRSTNLSTFTNDKMLPWGIIIKANEQNPITQSISTRNLGGVQGRKLQSPYHYKLVAQQARNIYLNMLEDKEA